MFLSIIVPCYNEQHNLPTLFEKTVSALAAYADNTEWIFVDDGSVDNTAAVLRDLCAKQPYPIKVLRFSRNFGKEAALLAGLEASDGEYVALIDADLQQNPKYIAQMLEILQNEPQYDSVAAYQDNRRESKLQIWCKKIFYALINKITDVEFFHAASDFRVLRRCMVDAIVALPEKCRFSKGIFSWVGFSTKYIPYKVEPRFSGKTKWNFWKLTAYAMNGIVAFSDKPLIISSLLGILLFTIAIILMLITVIQTLIFGNDVAGYPTLASLILLLSGIQLLTIGIIGQYLSKIYAEAKNRPVYILKETLDNQK